MRRTNCRRCTLASERLNIVWGDGPLDASVALVGEAPGEQEDRVGLPFVGRAGGLLTDILDETGVSALERPRLRIMNVLRCRPPGNRDPKKEEIAACSDWLNQELKELKNIRLVIGLGKPAAEALLSRCWPRPKKFESLTEVRRSIFEMITPVKTRLVVTYHPAYVLRMQRERKKVVEDLVWAYSKVLRG